MTQVPTILEGGQPAPAVRRLQAFAFDFLPLAAYIAFLAVVGVAVERATGGSSALRSPDAVDALAFATLVAPVILYFAWQEGGPNHATWGKRKMGLRVVGHLSAAPGRWRILLRSAIKFLPWQLAHTAVIHLWLGATSPVYLAVAIAAQLAVVVYAVCLWLGRAHRTPYDWVAGTRVVVTSR